MKIVLILLIIICCGCSAQLRTLIDLSSEQAGQKKDVALQKKRFKLLINDIKKERLKSGLSVEQIIERYGEPIIEREKDGQKIFLYRDPLDFFPAQKAYLYFDKDDILVNFELSEEENE